MAFEMFTTMKTTGYFKKLFRMRNGFLFLALLFFCLLPACTGLKCCSQQPAGLVSRHGALQVVGTQLCDNSGATIQLKGMSAHQLQFYPWTSNTVNNLVKQYHTTMIRAAMYVGEQGYLTDPAGMEAKERILIDAAIANEIYVIIDWHGVGGNPNKNIAEAHNCPV
jgi:hypothetical protein